MTPQPMFETRQIDEARVSVIVPCHNSAQFIARTLAALAPEIQAHPDAELLLVDNNSTDDTWALLHAAASEANTTTGREAVRVLRAAHGQGVNVARNFGAAHAQGELLLFTDHDDAVQPGWISAFRAAHAIGAQIMAGPYAEVSPDGDVVSEVDGPELHHWDIPYGLGSNSAITRAGFDAIGGFQEHWMGGGDDADFFWRAHFAGMPMVFVPGARIVHYLRGSDAATFRQYFGYGRSAVRLYAEFCGRGMPRSSTLRGLAAWPIASGELLLSLFGIGSRHRAWLRLAVRAGRLAESIAQRKRYL